MNSKLLVIAAASVFALAACERTAEGAREDTAGNSAAAQKAAADAVGMTVEQHRQHQCEQAEAERRARHEAAVEKARAEAEARRERHRAFAAAQGIPVAYQPWMALVRGGLTEGSRGNGADSRSVVHAQVLDAFRAGRVTRQRGDVLCRPNWTPSFGDGHSRPPEPGEQEITCPKCQEMLARFAKRT